MRIVLAGGSGHLGTVLARAFSASGDDVVVLSRGARAVAPPTASATRDGSRPTWRTVHWDARELGPWANEIDGADVVVNLAGRSVDCRYTPKNRQLIMDSRVASTRVIGEAIETADAPPRVWLQSSTATIYAHSFDHANDEATGVLGGSEANAPEAWRFSIEVAKAWERALAEARTPHTRRVAMRSAMTMTPDPGGIFDVLLRLVRFGLGGTAGSGKQYVSWLHDADFVNAIRFLIANDGLEGPVNLAAPGPRPYTEFMRVLRQAWGQPIGLPATKLMLEVGAVFLRTETELVLKSRRVVPGRLQEAGFEFAFPTWDAAARDLCERWRGVRRGEAEQRGGATAAA